MLTLFSEKGKQGFYSLITILAKVLQEIIKQLICEHLNRSATIRKLAKDKQINLVSFLTKLLSCLNWVNIVCLVLTKKHEGNKLDRKDKNSLMNKMVKNG